MEPNKTSWTQDDFEKMCWHDSTVKSISIDNPDEGYEFNLIFGLDYIVSWEPGEHYFESRPFILTFRNVDHLHINVSRTYKQPLEINNIERVEISSEREKNAGLSVFKYTIHFHAFCGQPASTIEFTATGFTQASAGQPPVD